MSSTRHRVGAKLASFGGIVMSGVSEHRLMVELADRIGWTPMETNHVMTIDVAEIGRWPDAPSGHRLRAMTVDDVAAVAAMHDVEFPSTYYSAGELAARAESGKQVVLVAPAGSTGGIVGYVAGQVQPDGDGYVDYLVVAPTARRTGVGRELLTAMARNLVPDASTQRVCLTVRAAGEGRVPNGADAYSGGNCIVQYSYE